MSSANGLLHRLKEKTRGLRREVFVMYLALQHPRTPWFAKVLACCVIAYALSPIDLIPDPIPVLGLLDDVLLVPLGVLAVRKLIPVEVLEECRAEAAHVEVPRAWRWAGGTIIASLWLGCLILMGMWIRASISH